MLVLTLRENDIVKIGEDSYLFIRRVQGKQVSIGFNTNRENKIERLDQYGNRKGKKEKKSLESGESESLNK